MNLILLFKDDFIGDGLVRLGGRRLRHVREVHRASVGDNLCVGESDGLIGTGRVTRLDVSCLEMRVKFERTPPAPLPVTLILALPRPKFLRRLLFHISVMGAKKIILLNSFRVEKSYWHTPFLHAESIEKQLLLGLEQACDTTMPGVLLRPLFKPFVEDELTEIVRGTLPLLAHPDAENPCPRDQKGPVTLAVGPEGGFIPYEVEKFKACGFSAVRLGDRTLNTESAVPALLSRIF